MRNWIKPCDASSLVVLSGNKILSNENCTLYNLDARRMLIRIYYEQGAWAALESQLDSFSVYLHRQTNIGYHRKIYLNLLRFIRKILNIAPTNISAKTLLREEIIKADVVAEREWLINLLE